jgi:hypothetical protein
MACTSDAAGMREPWWLRRGARWVLLLALAVLGISLLLVVLFDALGLGMSLGVTKEAMVWFALFRARGPIEWVQWLYLTAFVALVAHLVGRLSSPEAAAIDDTLRRFCLVMLIGVAFMLLEDAGDVRHELGFLIGELREGEASRATLLGLPQAFVIDLPYLTLMAAIPLYALVRYGRSVWAIRSARPYLVAGFSVYGLVGLAPSSGASATLAARTSRACTSTWGGSSTSRCSGARWSGRGTSPRAGSTTTWSTAW